MDLRGARVLLTGATGGIGRALAEELSDRGSELLLTGRRADALGRLAAETGGRALPADLTDRAGIVRLFEAAGEIDVLVANAALPAMGLLSEYSLEEVDRALDVNLRAPVVMAKLAAERMVARRRGHLVFIASLAGKAAAGQASLYSATKFGIRGFALALRQDLKTHGVGVSTVFPGFVRDTGMFAESGAVLPRGVATRSPHDVARATARAIENNTAEVSVAPLSLRLLALVGGAAPGLAAAVQRLLGGDEVAAQLTAGQRHKR